MSEQEPSAEYERQIAELSRRILTFADVLTFQEPESISGIRRATYRMPDMGGPLELTHLMAEYATDEGEADAVHSARLVLFGENVSSDTTNGALAVLTSDLGELEYIAGEELSNVSLFDQPETTRLLVRKVDRLVKWLSELVAQEALEHADDI